MPQRERQWGDLGAARPAFAEGAATFCAACRTGGAPEDRLCRGCGERLVECGYCPTCEEAWFLPIGDACPKHDLSLEAIPPPRDYHEADRWVTVAIYSHPNEANGPRIRLEAEGIPTFLDGERVAGTTPYQVATGGVRLQVPASLADPARVLLAQQWSAPSPGTPGEGDDEDDDDPWAGLAPVPGVRRRALMKMAILAFLIGPPLLTLLGRVLALLFGGDWA